MLKMYTGEASIQSIYRGDASKLMGIRDVASIAINKK